MIFNQHFRLKDRHAHLSASKHAWTNYDDEKFDRFFMTSMAAARGTRLHKLAHDAIELGVKFPDNDQTINRYVNDAIGFRMKPEQTLYYSDNCFGTADAISYRNKILRIHDLKTGVGVVSIKQLEIYAALFCLEYDQEPFELDEIILAIYQNDDVYVYDGDPDTIKKLMGTIVRFDARIEEMKSEGL